MFNKIAQFSFFFSVLLLLLLWHTLHIYVYVSDASDICDIIYMCLCMLKGIPFVPVCGVLSH